MSDPTTESVQKSIISHYSIPSDTDGVELTEGEIIMDISFNPVARQDVHTIKRIAAILYNWLQDICREVPDNDMERYNRKQRSKSIAFTFLETFVLNAMKAVMYTKEFIGEERTIISKHVPSEGYLAMKLDFNNSESEYISIIKKEAADLYDTMEDEMQYRHEDLKAAEKKYYHDLAQKTQEDFDLLTPEEKEKYQQNYRSTAQVMPALSEELILAHRKLGHSREAMGDALYNLRQFQMYAVKAVTR